MKGSYTLGETDIKYNCTFKKGWNIVYSIIDNTKEGSNATWTTTTKKPAKDKLTWYFSEGNYLLSIENIKSSENLDHFAPIPSFLCFF
jgi:hypothetical protein